jgi:hypothetical protein
VCFEYKCAQSLVFELVICGLMTEINFDSMVLSLLMGRNLIGDTARLQLIGDGGCWNKDKSPTIKKYT